MTKLYDHDGFCVFGTQPKATQLIVKDRLYTIVDKSNNKEMNDVQKMHVTGQIDVHAKCIDWRSVISHPLKGGNKYNDFHVKGNLKVFPSIAQQWKNQMKGRYVKPTSYSTSTDPKAVSEQEYLETIKFYSEKH